MLTGATGFVGIFLLAELLRRRPGRVYCLVRGDDADHVMRRLEATYRAYNLRLDRYRDRIVPLAGDLGRAHLGLGTRGFGSLHARIGGIVHCGATVNWGASYDDLKTVNVGGTEQILQLAARGPNVLPVHYISTVGVFSSHASSSEAVTERIDIGDSGPLDNGYARTKWVGEHMVGRARRRGLPVAIHRINTGAHSITGQFNRRDYLAMITRGCIESRSVPDKLGLPFQPAPIDYVAQAIVHLAITSATGTYHLVNKTMTWPWYFSCLRARGYTFRTFPFETWRQHLKSFRTASAPVCELVDVLPREGARLPPVAANRTRDILAAAGIHCPPPTPQLVNTFLDALVATGYIPAP
ncbi:hypothetical protein GCM10027089_41910 [Nocardia thraciensis]